MCTLASTRVFQLRCERKPPRSRLRWRRSRECNLLTAIDGFPCTGCVQFRCRLIDDVARRMCSTRSRTPSHFFAYSRWYNKDVVGANTHLLNANRRTLRATHLLETSIHQLQLFARESGGLAQSVDAVGTVPRQRAVAFLVFHISCKYIFMSMIYNQDLFFHIF